MSCTVAPSHVADHAAFNSGTGSSWCAHAARRQATGGRAHLVNEEHAWHNLRLALFPPLGHFGIDLLPHLRPDLPCVASKQRQKPLQTLQVVLRLCATVLGACHGQHALCHADTPTPRLYCTNAAWE